jgi:hypothetical protein
LVPNPDLGTKSKCKRVKFALEQAVKAQRGSRGRDGG